MASIDHQSLGKIRGLQVDGVDKYLGIKFASLAHRFALPELLGKRGGDGSEIDATKLGPATEQWPQGIDVEFALIQQTLDKPPYAISATEGLTANVFTPAGVKPGDRLPVLVWIYGGGYLHGSNTWGQYSLERLVRLSKEQGTPIVAVALNYRLNVAGFLTSSELVKAGIKPNRGILDQAAGLKWVKQHIDGFGGDSNNITAMGQSIGGASVTWLLHSKEPLFNRVIALGGNAVGIKQLPPFLPDAVVYPAVIKSLGLADLSPEQRIEKLKTVPYEEILAKLPPGLPLLAVNDDELLPPALTFENLSSEFPKDHWCKEVFVGDCALDANVFGVTGLNSKRQGIGKVFAISVRSSLNVKPAAAEALLKAYGIDENAPNDDSDFLAIIKFASDIGFDTTAAALAEEWSTHSSSKAVRYYFNEGNPWPGEYKGHAVHILDAAFLFQNFNEKLDEKQVKIAKRMGRDVISFINGNGVQQDFEQNGIPTVVYGKCEEPAVGDTRTGRRTFVQQLVEKQGVSKDELLGTWLTFMQS